MAPVSTLKVVLIGTLAFQLHLAYSQNGFNKTMKIRKCCPLKHKFNFADFQGLKNSKCREPTSVSFSWPPEVFDFDTNAKIAIPIKKWGFDVGNPICSNNKTAFYISQDLSATTNDAFLASDGFLYLTKHQVALRPDQFCVDETADNDQVQLVVNYCSAIMGKSEVHIQKCCPEGLAPKLEQDTVTCDTPYAKPLKLNFTSTGELGSPKINFSISFPHCKDNFYILNTEEMLYHDAYFTLNGELLLDNGVHIPTEKYCVDHIFESAKKPQKVNALICQAEEASNKANALNPINVYMWATILTQLLIIKYTL